MIKWDVRVTVTMEMIFRVTVVAAGW